MLATLKQAIRGGNGAAYQPATRMLRDAQQSKVDITPSTEAQVGVFLDDPAWKVRNVGVKLVGALRLNVHRQRVIEFMLDQRQVGFIRRNAATAIGQFDDMPSPADEALRKALEDRYWEVRIEAIKALATFAVSSVDAEWQAGVEDLFADFLESFPSKSILGGQGTRWIEPVFEVREAALIALGSFASGYRALSLCMAVLEAPMWKLRAAAIEATVAIAIRGKHEAGPVEAALAHLDRSCIDMRPRFPLNQAYNRAMEAWDKFAPVQNDGGRS